MFSNADSFNQDIGGWDVSNIGYMDSLFYDAVSFNQDIGGWEVSNVVNMTSVFQNAIHFKQDLSNWCVSYFETEPANFATGSSMIEEYMPVWGTGNCIQTSIEEEEIPAEFSLSQNYPNPFNPTTNISYNLPQASMVTIGVYNLLGQQVALLVNEYKSAGPHTVSFNASEISSGMYIYRMESENFVRSKKLLLIK